MAEEGSDLKLYPLLSSTIDRQLEGKSTPQAEKEYSRLNAIMQQTGHGIPEHTVTKTVKEVVPELNRRGIQKRDKQGNLRTKTIKRKVTETIPSQPGEAEATDIATTGRIEDTFGQGVAQGNQEDIAMRRQRLLNSFDQDLSQSERKFRQAIRERGFSNALDMFTVQLESRTQTQVAATNRAAEGDKARAEMAFQAGQSELDRILAREGLQTQLKIASIQQKAEKKKSKGGLFGSILGTIGGLALALPTGGLSLGAGAALGGSVGGKVGASASAF